MTPEDRLLEYDGFPADDYLVPGDYASYLSTRLRARLPDVREYSQEEASDPAFYEAQAEVDAPAGPAGAMLGDVPFPPGMEVALDPTLGLGSAIVILTDLRQAPPQLQLDPEHATHISACLEIPGALPKVLLRSVLHRQVTSGAPREGVGDWEATEAPIPPGQRCCLSPDGG
ncbi:hypothetical protein JCGZ_22806 [Jatropha curcas]|uniref:Uncharacterized protein n=1 Tax=Jatropha curcas TaxID=180498 RepID=A0A067LGI0_JATCU|nr:hypothetical protein JCGZ_22806 [Jatropha curcas]